MKSRIDKKNYTNVGKKTHTTYAKPAKNWILGEEKAYRQKKMWYIDVCVPMWVNYRGLISRICKDPQESKVTYQWMN